jgi:hypothetical protein
MLTNNEYIHKAIKSFDVFASSSTEREIKFLSLNLVMRAIGGYGQLRFTIRYSP